VSVFGLPVADVAAAVRALAPDTVPRLDRDGIEERFARAALGHLGEPGDGVLGALVAALGASATLAALVERRPAESVHAEARAAGCALTPAETAAGIARWSPRLSAGRVLTTLTRSARFGMRIVQPGDTAWPDGLDDLGAHAPLLLWVRGEPERLTALARSIALVGARAATGYGEHVAMESSAGLVDRGFAVVSGAAFGIDGAAHRAAIAAGGVTVAAMAGGLDRCSPSGHQTLFDRIIDTGAVVAEVPLGTPPTRHRFLQRNRIIAALAGATVVLEAAYRSGSLNTAGHAAALGRPLGAVPGPVTSSTSAGCHRLIRDYGAELVTSADEMAALAGDPEASAPHERGPSSEEIRVLDALAPRSARDADDVARRAGLSLAGAQAALGALELEGLAARGERGWVRRG